MAESATILGARFSTGTITSSNGPCSAVGIASLNALSLRSALISTIPPFAVWKLAGTPSVDRGAPSAPAAVSKSSAASVCRSPLS